MLSNYQINENHMYNTVGFESGKTRFLNGLNSLEGDILN